MNELDVILMVAPIDLVNASIDKMDEYNIHISWICLCSSLGDGQGFGHAGMDGHGILPVVSQEGTISIYERGKP